MICVHLVDQLRVPTLDDVPPDLAGGRELVPEGPREDPEGEHPLLEGQRVARGPHLLLDELEDLLVPGQRRVGRHRDPPPPRPVAGRLLVQLDERSDERPAGGDDHGAADVRGGLERALDLRRRDRVAGGGREHVDTPAHRDHAPLPVETGEVAAGEPAVVVRHPATVERPDRHAGAAHEQLLVLEAELDGRVDRGAGRAEVALAALRRHDPARLDLAVLLPKGDAECPEPAQGLGCDEGAADAGVADVPEPGLPRQEVGHEPPGEPGAGAGAAATGDARVRGPREPAHRPVVRRALEPAGVRSSGAPRRPRMRSSSRGVATRTVGAASTRSVGTVSRDSAKLSVEPATSGA